jgi:hypothetical protein
MLLRLLHHRGCCGCCRGCCRGAAAAAAEADAPAGWAARLQGRPASPSPSIPPHRAADDPGEIRAGPEPGRIRLRVDPADMRMCVVHPVRCGSGAARTHTILMGSALVEEREAAVT